MNFRINKFEAAAGSGKTYTLSIEFLKHLFEIFEQKRGQITPEYQIERSLASILAITFTNKAANEMKARILESLKRFSLYKKGFPISDEYKSFLRKLSEICNIQESKLIEFSDIILDYVIANYSDFNVKTIDSLMSSIITVLSPDLNLPADFEISIDSYADLNRTARQFLAEFSKSDWTKIEKVLEDIKRTVTLKKWRLDEYLIENIIIYYSIGLNQLIPDPEDLRYDQSKLLKIFHLFKQELTNLLTVISQEPTDMGRNKYLNGKRINRPLCSAIRHFLGNKNNIAEIDSLVSKKFFSDSDCSGHFKRDAPPEYKKIFELHFNKTKKSLSEFIFHISRHRLANFSQFFSDFLSFWEKGRRKIFVEEFSRTIMKRLAEWEKTALPYIYLKLSDRFNYFLFDEFQDTSELQFKALTPILDEVLTSNEKSSLFFVGDRKQAIYRWRGGNADLMNEYRLRNELPSLNLIQRNSFTKNLKINWRSRKNIVDFNNRFWDSDNLQIMLSRCGVSEKVIEAILKNFADSQQKIPDDEKKKGGFVEVILNNSEHPDEDNRAKKLLFSECLQAIEFSQERGYYGADIAILVRTNEDSREIVRFLTERDIPTISDESLYLSSSKLINEIICFFKFLNYPPDNLSFYNFVSGEIFQTVARELFPQEMKNFSESIFLLNRQSEFYYIDFRTDFPETWQALIEPFFKVVGFLPPYDLFQDFSYHFDLFENFEHAAVFFLSFAEKLHDLEKNDIGSISSFLNEWQEMLNSRNQYGIDISEDRFRIRVLTIHKAKGLEFPVVILPLESKKNPPFNQVYFENGNFHYIIKNYAQTNEILRKIYLNEIEKEYIDELNLLYVAFTRAKEGLLIPVVFTGKNQTEVEEFRRFKDFADIVSNHPGIEPELQANKRTSIKFGKLTKKIPVTGDISEAVETLSVSTKLMSTGNWQREFLVFSPSRLFSEQEKEGIKRGNKIHRLLARVEKFQSKKELNTVLSGLIAEEDLDKKDLELLTKFLKDDRIFPYFFGDIYFFNEKEIAIFSSGQCEIKRIDRLVINGNEITVIDYKTGLEKETAYHDQVREYMVALKPLYPDKVCRGYLFYLDLGEMEEVYC